MSEAIFRGRVNLEHGQVELLVEVDGVVKVIGAREVRAVQPIVHGRFALDANAGNSKDALSVTTAFSQDVALVMMSREGGPWMPIREAPKMQASIVHVAGSEDTIQFSAHGAPPVDLHKPLGMSPVG